MKKYLAAAVLAGTLSACIESGNVNTQGESTANTNIGTNIAKTLIDNQCRTELNQRSEWKLIVMAMTAEQKQRWEDKICGCASEEVLQSITLTDMAKLLDPNQRTQVLADVSVKTVTACVNRLMK
ncbi:hypothetical protein [Stenoxybacter acetivorans]|uniref:hypothetical protein n=1 Tax=Stenoxybacter acetivorans TaxID=422441 RepID=UPI00055E0438|nr:hypothetical protein [Stenoxybacter acetivorans]